MSDWKQIQARIRRAKAGQDAAVQLEKLFERTRDAMVAYELARHLEGAGQPGDAARWYETAAQRFRRADWKKKAAEGAARLIGTSSQKDSPVGLVDEPDRPLDAAAEGRVVASAAVQGEDSTPRGQSEDAVQQDTQALSSNVPVEEKRRRRGRRGGRRRRRKPETQAAGGESAAARVETRAEPRAMAPAAAPSRTAERVSSQTAEATSPGLRARSGDPGLASRLAHLEMQLRRLLACTPVKLDQAERAPAGPGVFLVTDSDLTTYYYVEACKTLRIGIANLLRGGASRGEDGSLKARFAEHLGISESRVGKYVGDHCVIRWLQLDESASNFAHFTIAVLRPVLND